MRRSLPRHPSLESNRKQAKALLKQWRAGEPEALERVRTHHPRYARDPEARDPSLADAQLVIAREYGFASWPRLKQRIEALTADLQERVRLLVDSACRGDIRRAEALLEHDPTLGAHDLATACVVGDEGRALALLASDAGQVNAELPPLGWRPLVYVCHSRFGAGRPEVVAARLRIVEALLAAGADPNAYAKNDAHPEWRLSALYGAVGKNDYPALGEALLEAGAVPDDEESIFHAAEHAHIEGLRALHAHGVDVDARGNSFGQRPIAFLLQQECRTANSDARKTGVRWLLEHGADPNLPSGKNRETALHRAAVAGYGADVGELLLAHGADLTARTAAGLDAAQLALDACNGGLLEWLVRHGCEPAPSAQTRFLSACVRGDRAEAATALRAQPDLIATLSSAQRALHVACAWRGSSEALSLMLELGFAVDATAHEGETALHAAAWTGQDDKVALLLEHDPPLEAHCSSFGSTPLGWAAHGSANCRNPAGDYPRVATLLLQAGADPSGTENKWRGNLLTVAADDLADVLRAHGARD